MILIESKGSLPREGMIPANCFICNAQLDIGTNSLVETESCHGIILSFSKTQS